MAELQSIDNYEVVVDNTLKNEHEKSEDDQNESSSQ